MTYTEPCARCGNPYSPPPDMIGFWHLHRECLADQKWEERQEVVQQTTRVVSDQVTRSYQVKLELAEQRAQRAEQHTHKLEERLEEASGAYERGRQDAVVELGKATEHIVRAIRDACNWLLAPERPRAQRSLPVVLLERFK